MTGYIYYSDGNMREIYNVTDFEMKGLYIDITTTTGKAIVNLNDVVLFETKTV